jgi:hypothetical protein
MRLELLYILFITIALSFISLDESRNKQLRNDVQSCQIISGNINRVCTVPEFSLSLKTVSSGSTFLRIIHKGLFENVRDSRFDLSVNNLELYKKKIIAIIPLKQKILLLFLCNKSNNDADHNLFE